MMMKAQTLTLLLLFCLGQQDVLALSSPNPAKGKGLKPFGGGGGGRKPLSPNMPSLRNVDEEDEETEKRWEPTPPKPSEARLTVVQVTDVYTLSVEKDFLWVMCCAMKWLLMILFMFFSQGTFCQSQDNVERHASQNSRIS